MRTLSDSPTVRKKTGDINYEHDSCVHDFWPLKKPFENLCRSQGRGTECYNRFLNFTRESEKPEYDDDIKKMISESPVIKIGDPFDIISLLSFKGQSNYLIRNNDDNRVELNKDTFQGKYVMVCCFHAPIHCLDEEATTFQSIADVCYEMFDYFDDDDFEIVLVLKMNTKYNHQWVFSNFLSAFPPSCLVVPFDDPNRRDYICCYLDIRLPCKCFIVDRTSIAVFHSFPDFATDQGADAFPFNSNYSAKELEFMSMPKTTQLQEVMLSIASNNVVHRINQEGVHEEVSFSRLNEKKVVGLYLFNEGSCCITKESSIHTLRKAYKKCRKNQLEFEIVVVYIPFCHCLSPEVFQEKVDNFMEKNKISWWRMPYNNSKCLKLWKICGYDPNKLLIVGPRNEYVGVHGQEILTKYGSDGYPFTREGLISNHVKLLRELTLGSLLTSELYDYVLKGGDTPISVASLQPRNTLLYFDFSSKDTWPFEHLQKWYDKIKTKYPGYEVIYVRRNNKEDFDIEAIDPALSDIPWLVRPFQSKHSRSVVKKLFPPRVFPFDTLVEFGIDGHVCSVDTQNLYEDERRDGIPLECNLRRDVINRLRGSLWCMEECMEDMVRYLWCPT
ncbi:probable nucleoredoxin 1 [Spinacia oleracea]|uniref:Probable nucleoredoxin 1 n=1 Tax=Spinacia oleracea TaxID=3562 RepID=A0ABM3QHG7_SPIOL|nr:probable nucleoredoxin 1 [Spinacia oleracea]